MNIWESLAQVDGRKSLERRVGGSFEKKREKKEKRMAVDLIELRVREVSNDFVVRYGALWGGEYCALNQTTMIWTNIDSLMNFFLAEAESLFISGNQVLKVMALPN